jgi:hypothetical protein
MPLLVHEITKDFGSVAPNPSGRNVKRNWKTTPGAMARIRGDPFSRKLTPTSPRTSTCMLRWLRTQLYGVSRTTSDVDFLAVVPNVQRKFTEIGGKGSPLHRIHKLYLDAVTVATPPEDYAQRLVPMFPGSRTHLRLHALEAHDVASTVISSARAARSYTGRWRFRRLLQLPGGLSGSREPDSVRRHAGH